MCNVRTKKCECNTFWMENPFKARLGKKESNCGKGEVQEKGKGGRRRGRRKKGD